EDLLDRIPRAQQFRVERVPRLPGGRREAHDLIHVHPIRPVGRDPSGRGMRVKEIPLVLQLAHGVPDGGGRHAKPEAADNGLASGGLSGLDVGLDDRFEDLELPLAQLVWAGHDRGNLFGLTALRAAPTVREDTPTARDELTFCTPETTPWPTPVPNAPTRWSSASTTVPTVTGSASRRQPGTFEESAHPTWRRHSLGCCSTAPRSAAPAPTS